MILILRHVLLGLWTANRGHTSIDKLFWKFAGFCRRSHENLPNSHQWTVLQSDSRLQQPSKRRLRHQLDASAAHNSLLRSQSRAARYMLAAKEEKISTHTTDHYCIPSMRRGRVFDTEEERELKQSHAFDFCGAFAYHQCRYDEDEDDGLAS